LSLVAAQTAMMWPLKSWEVGQALSDDDVGGKQLQIEAVGEIGRTLRYDGEDWKAGGQAHHAD
jgi:hypothetical protein